MHSIVRGAPNLEEIVIHSAGVDDLASYYALVLHTRLTNTSYTGEHRIRTCWVLKTRADLYSRSRLHDGR